MYILCKIDSDFNYRTTYKSNFFDEIEHHLSKILEDYLKCNMVMSDSVFQYCKQKLLDQGYIYIWELMRTLAHSAYPYEHHRIVLIDTSKL